MLKFWIIDVATLYKVQTRISILRVSECYMSHNPLQTASPLFDQSQTERDTVRRKEVAAPM